MDLKIIRKNLGLSQRKFAELLEVPYSTIRNWEQGLATPPEYVIKYIVYYLKNEGYTIE